MLKNINKAEWARLSRIKILWTSQLEAGNNNNLQIKRRVIICC